MAATSTRARAARPVPDKPDSSPKGKPDSEPSEHEILFQQFFKSVGPRTYVSQVKRANNGNHYLVLTEGKRDEKTDQVRKTRLFIFGEDFVEFFKLMKATAEFVKARPVPDEVKKKRDRFWAGQTPANPGAGAR